MLKGGSAAVGVGYRQGGRAEKGGRAGWAALQQVARRNATRLQDSHTFAPLFSGSRGSHFGCLQDLTDLARLRILATTAERLPA